MIKIISMLLAASLAMSMPVCANAAEQTKATQHAGHKSSKSHTGKHKPSGIILKNSTQKLSYAFGLQVGDSLKQGHIKMDMDLFLLGFQDIIEGKKPLLSAKKAKKIRDKFYAQKRQLLAEKNQRQATEFLRKNRKKRGIKTTSSGLQYTVLRKGYGAHPGASSIVRVQYSARLTDGTEFYSTYKKGRSVVLPVKGVIGGLGEAFELMTVGSHYRFFIPPKLAYGDHGSGKKVEPNVALVYDIELLAIESPKF